MFVGQHFRLPNLNFFHLSSYCTIWAILFSVMLFQNNFINELEYQFILYHLGTHLIFPWHGFEHQARSWNITVQLVASNSAKLLSPLIADITFEFSEIAWKLPFFSCISPGHGAGAPLGWDLAAVLVEPEFAVEKLFFHLRTCLTVSAVNIIINK